MAEDVTDKPVELDEHRGMAAQKSTETRRRLRDVEADQLALRHRQQKFESHAVTAPSTNWTDVAEKARYLIELFAATPEARDPRRQALITSVLQDLVRFPSESNQSGGLRRGGLLALCLGTLRMAALIQTLRPALRHQDSR
jgi:hypothetical protein